MQVLTIKGPLDLDSLTVKDVVELVDNGRKVSTEYYLSPQCHPGLWPKGDLVKRTVTVDILMPLTSQSVQGQINGQ